MKQFIIRILLFCFLVIGLLCFSLFYIPDTVSKDTLLGALPFKHELLKKTPSPKIIFVGGSNVSFGLDSKKISDALHLPVVNTAIHAGIGLEYMVNDIKPFIHKNDLVVLIPEYENFYSDNFYGEMELVSLLFDIYQPGIKLITKKQWMHLMNYLPTYAAKKLKNYVSNGIYKKPKPKEIGVYDRESFNSYGDEMMHWAMPDQNFISMNVKTKNEKINPEVILFLKSFNDYVSNKGAHLLLLPPVIESESFANQKNMTDSITNYLHKNKTPYLSLPTKYVMDKSYFFNSFYHTNKKGVDLRTRYVIEDLSLFLKKHHLINSIDNH